MDQRSPHERHSRLIDPLLLALAFLASLCLAPASATTFPPYGGGGDASFSDTCPNGEYLVGLRVRSGLWLDQMAISCRTLTGDLGGPYYGPKRGGGGGGPSEGHCPGGYVIHNMNFTLTAGNRQVINFTFRCQSTTDKSKTSILQIGSAATNNNPYPPGQSCPAVEAATGMNGRYGKHVNAVGLICGKLVVP
jgi:hypothetical protein